MTALHRLALIAAAVTLAGHAQAQTIDFDELAHRSANGYQTWSHIDADGFRFDSSMDNDHALGVWSSGSNWQADADGAAVFVNFGYSTTTMSHLGGQSFNFTSIDFGDVYNRAQAATVRFTFDYAAGGSSVNEVVLDSLRGLQTLTFNQAGLSRVSWQTIAGGGGWGQFDNVNVGMAGVMAPVPEPQTYALMLAGLAVVAFVARRRRPQE
jgi:PEP-CTERM motif